MIQVRYLNKKGLLLYAALCRIKPIYTNFIKEKYYEQTAEFSF